jgi:hydrogenase maturation protease
MKPTLPAAPVWVIGIGNTLRRDDGAGWLLAQALAATLEEAGCPVHLTLQPQLLPELAAEATELQPAQVIFVDASTAVSSPHFTPLSPGTVADSSHGLTPAGLLTLLQRLYALQPAAWLLQTPGQEFGHGEGLSENARQALQAAPALAACWLATHQAQTDRPPHPICEVSPIGL